MNVEMNVEMKILDDRLNTLGVSYGSEGSAGLDLRACIEQELCLQPNEVKLIGTGLAVYLADPGFASLIVPRSGLGHKGLVMGNLVGVIDSDYQGELKMSVWNRSKEMIAIQPMDRIAQLVIVPVLRPTFNIVEEFSDLSDRGGNGFNSTGTA